MIFNLAIIGLIFITSSAHALQRGCFEQEMILENVIKRIHEIRNAKPYKGSHKDLATMHMIASIHKTYLFCEPFGPNALSEWGAFLPLDDHVKQKIIFWDGEVRDVNHLNEAKKLLLQDFPQDRDYHRHDKLKLGWVFEKLGETKKAIIIYKETYIKESSKIKNSAFCRMSQCSELLATIESLQYLKRIFEKMNKRDKVLETEKLLNKYEKMRVFKKTVP
jgi:tetratricopeptide (TPR) repeat protein